LISSLGFWQEVERVNKELVQNIREKNVILFVGAGVSQNLELPSTEQLVQQIANDLGYDPEVFKTYGDYLTLAEYYRLEKGTIAPLRSWMDRKLHSDVDVSKSDIHKIIVNLQFPIIYTTNYDRWLERAHDIHRREYTKVANVSDLAKVKPGITQIVKFHGDFDGDDESIVLTETSYFERLDFESPLDIKLRADLLGKSVLFIGYSLTDIDLRYMLYKLNKQWDASSFASARPKSFVFLTRPNPVQERVWASRGISAIVSDCDKPSDGLRKFLQQLQDELVG
jgi:hypothetical protein